MAILKKKEKGDVLLKRYLFAVLICIIFSMGIFSGCGENEQVKENDELVQREAPAHFCIHLWISFTYRNEFVMMLETSLFMQKIYHKDWGQSRKEEWLCEKIAYLFKGICQREYSGTIV